MCHSASPLVRLQFDLIRTGTCSDFGVVEDRRCYVIVERVGEAYRIYRQANCVVAQAVQLVVEGLDDSTSEAEAPSCMCLVSCFHHWVH
jgi:hypothetical protein